MIFIGLASMEKAVRVREYCDAHAVRKVVIFSPSKFRPDLALDTEYEHVEWSDIIQYKFYYRLLQEIGRETLLVINECLRTQNRYELTYNCLRLFLQQTPHALIFQHLPIIDTIDDFAVLFDFETRSRWKRHKLDAALLREAQIEVSDHGPLFAALPVETDERTRAAYAKEKRKLIDGIGLKDPHTIPRNLYQMSGKAKLPHVDAGKQYMGRNNRFHLDNLRTYRDEAFPGQHVVFELCHNFINFADFLTLSRQQSVDVMVADLKVDHWYFDRYAKWATRIHEACSVLRG
jgi:hypothetical protein